MGYTTDFEGAFKLDRPLTEQQAAYLEAFATSRRMRRDAGAAARHSDIARTLVGLGIGDEGGYYVGHSNYSDAQNGKASVADGNVPPAGQPSLWCDWHPTADRTGIEWNGSEKFYEYVPWLQYIIEHFLKPWGYVLSGAVTWQGEDDSEGTITVVANRVSTQARALKRKKLANVADELPADERAVIRDAFLEGKDSIACAMLLDAITTARGRKAPPKGGK